MIVLLPFTISLDYWIKKKKICVVKNNYKHSKHKMFEYNWLTITNILLQNHLKTPSYLISLEILCMTTYANRMRGGFYFYLGSWICYMWMWMKYLCYTRIYSRRCSNIRVTIERESVYELEMLRKMDKKGK